MRREPFLREYGRMDATRQLAQFLDRNLKLVDRLGEDPLDLRIEIPAELALSKPELERKRDQSLLRTVVQVALDPAPLRVGRLGQARAGSLQLGQPGAQLSLKARVLERQRGSGAHRLHELLVLSERRSWISAAIGSPSRSTTVAVRSPLGHGSCTGEPPEST